MAVHATQASKSAANATLIDYSLMRVGTVIHRWRGRVIERVARCPECGRNGGRSETVPLAPAAARGEKPFVSYDHRVIDGITTDWCFSRKETEALQMREAAKS